MQPKGASQLRSAPRPSRKMIRQSKLGRSAQHSTYQGTCIHLQELQMRGRVRGIV